MLVLPQNLTAPFSTFHLNYYFPIHRHTRLSAVNSVSPNAVTISNQLSFSPSNELYSIHNRRYDFTPLLRFLSTSSSDSVGPTSTASPTSLDPTEFQLAQSYRAVPAQLWRSLLKSLCSSSSSIGVACALVSWLHKHKLCFSYELLYSILIHALGKSEKLYEAFLLSQRQSLTPLTYNALISACARNGDFEKALNLMSRMRNDGYPPDAVNYSSIIQSLISCSGCCV